MTPRLVACFAAIAFSLATPVQGCLGDNEAEIKARYGMPREFLSDQDAALPAKRQLFHFKSFNIVVVFVDGKSVCELISKKEGAQLDADEISGLLAANAAKGQTWKKDSQAYWRRSDGGAVAEYAAGMLQIYTAEWQRKLNRAVDDILRDKTKEF